MQTFKSISKKHPVAAGILGAAALFGVITGTIYTIQFFRKKEVQVHSRVEITRYEQIRHTRQVGLLLARRARQALIRARQQHQVEADCVARAAHLRQLAQTQLEHHRSIRLFNQRSVLQTENQRALVLGLITKTKQEKQARIAEEKEHILRLRRIGLCLAMKYNSFLSKKNRRRLADIARKQQKKIGKEKERNETKKLDSPARLSEKHINEPKTVIIGQNMLSVLSGKVTSVKPFIIEGDTKDTTKFVSLNKITAPAYIRELRWTLIRQRGSTVRKHPETGMPWMSPQQLAELDAELKAYSENLVIPMEYAIMAIPEDRVVALNRSARFLFNQNRAAKIKDNASSKKSIATGNTLRPHTGYVADKTFDVFDDDLPDLDDPFFKSSGLPVTSLTADFANAADAYLDSPLISFTDPIGTGRNIKEKKTKLAVIPPTITPRPPKVDLKEIMEMQAQAAERNEELSGITTISYSKAGRQGPKPVRLVPEDSKDHN